MHRSITVRERPGIHELGSGSQPPGALLAKTKTMLPAVIGKLARRTESLRAFVLALLIAISPAALAEKPEMISLDTAYTDDCGFPIVVHVTGKLMYQYEPRNPPGSIWKGFSVNVQATYTNPETGVSVMVRQSGKEIQLSEEITEDGLLVQRTISNAAIRLSVPDGPQALDVGPVSITYIWDLETGAILDMILDPHSSSPHQDLGALICHLLAP